MVESWTKIHAVNLNKWENLSNTKMKKKKTIRMKGDGYERQEPNGNIIHFSFEITVRICKNCCTFRKVRIWDIRWNQPQRYKKCAFLKWWKHTVHFSTSFSLTPKLKEKKNDTAIKNLFHTKLPLKNSLTFIDQMKWLMNQKWNIQNYDKNDYDEQTKIIQRVKHRERERVMELRIIACCEHFLYT